MKFLTFVSYYGLYIPYELEVEGVKVIFTHDEYASTFLVQSYSRAYRSNLNKFLSLQFNVRNNQLSYDL